MEKPLLSPLLSIKDLRVSFRIDGQYYNAVDHVSLDVMPNEVFAIVGESGSGKSALALSIPRLHNMNYTRLHGNIFYDEKDLLVLRENQLNQIRGAHISMIFQDPLTSLNPLIKVGPQIEESLTYHTSMGKAEKKARALLLLDQVGIKNPPITYGSFPHELSGGMRQRAVIAVALACKPSLIIADEPTTALDVTIQAQILDLLRSLQKETKSSIILITHDLGVVAEMADRVAVMYAGQIVEIAPALKLFKEPHHPYTRSLLASIPHGDTVSKRLNAIKGIVPSLKYIPRTGCRFSHRTPWIPAERHQEEPKYHQVGQDHMVLCTCYKDFFFEEVRS
ncbi:MAG: ABC transporter ATP-binding protein [Defluviitaleaceae bacterium]|nr:ABC transporter ATP-binding protein [Defluviitaleaceae bacterium]